LKGAHTTVRVNDIRPIYSEVSERLCAGEASEIERVIASGWVDLNFEFVKNISKGTEQM
jgi:hypothetical protein